MRSTLPMLAIALVGLFASTGHAQETSPAALAPVPQYPYMPPMAPYHHMSTVYGDALMGLAAVIGADGNYELLKSQARILDQIEYNMALQNKVNTTKYYIERKELLSQYHDLVRLQKRTRLVESKQMLKVKERELAEKYRLERFELDPKSGTVFWPALVSGPRFATQRTEIDRLVKLIVQYGYTSNQRLRHELTEACNEFRKDLQLELENHANKDLPSVYREYVEMDRFLKGVRYTPILMESADPSLLLSMEY